jgi:hypothetical protein
MTEQLQSIVNGAIVATQIVLDSRELTTNKMLLVTPGGLMARECYLDLTNPAHLAPAMSELRALARKTKAHVVVIAMPLLDSVVFYVEVKDWAAWQGKAPIQAGSLLPFLFEDGTRSRFNPVFGPHNGTPVIGPDAG